MVHDRILAPSVPIGSIAGGWDPLLCTFIYTVYVAYPFGVELSGGSFE
jgi:hypothetical protein